ncbi:MAG: hypothetical protein ABI601_11505 [bacterium]
MLIAITLLAALHLAPADSINGTWLLKGDVVGNPLNTTCDIKQTGTTLSGSCVNETGAAMPITGTVKGDSVTFQHGGDYQGQELTIIYAGKLTTPKKLEGTITVKPFDAAGTFTAEPAPAKK